MRSCISLPISILLCGQIRLAIANSNKVIAIRSIIYKPRATCTIRAIHRVKAFTNAANMTMHGAKIVYNFLPFFVDRICAIIFPVKNISRYRRVKKGLSEAYPETIAQSKRVVISCFFRSIECVLYIGAIVAPTLERSAFNIANAAYNEPA